MQDSFKARRKLEAGGRSYEYYALDALADYPVGRLPYSLKILLENLLRHEDGKSVTRDDIVALATADPRKLPQREIAFTPARVIMQDFTGVPAVVDLAAMRDAMAKLGGDPGRINPLIPAELVIDHSVMVDHYGSADALNLNALLEFQRNKERYSFLRWGQSAFDNFAVVPPDTGIVHQVNLEYLARVVFADDEGLAYPDTVVGTDSHTTMINGVGVLGWGVGGIEAEAAMLGQPSTMLIPEVIGVKLAGPSRRRRDRNRSRPDGDGDAAQARRRREVRGILRRRPRPVAAGRPRHDREHGAGIRRDLRHIPDRRGDARLSPPHGPR